MVGGVPLNRGKASRGPVRHEGIVRVPTVDFARFLRERYCVKDNVLLKLDIEGAEFELLEHVLADGAAPILDTVVVEWHTVKRAGSERLLGKHAGKKGNGAKEALQRMRERQQRIERDLKRVGVRFDEWKM